MNENEISMLCYIETFKFQYNDVNIIIWHLICLRYHFDESCRNVRHNDNWISRWFWCASRKTKLTLILYRKKLPKLFKFIFIDSHHYVPSSRWIAAIDFWWKVNFVVFYPTNQGGRTSDFTHYHMVSFMIEDTLIIPTEWTALISWDVAYQNTQ